MHADAPPTAAEAAFRDDGRRAGGVGRGGARLPPGVLAALTALDDRRSLRAMAPTLAAALATLLGPEPGAAGGVEAASPTAPAADGQPQSPITNTTTEPRPQ